MSFVSTNLFWLYENKVWIRKVLADAAAPDIHREWVARLRSRRDWLVSSLPGFDYGSLDVPQLQRFGVTFLPPAAAANLKALERILLDPERAALASCGQRYFIKMHLGYQTDYRPMSFAEIAERWEMPEEKVANVYASGLAAWKDPALRVDGDARDQVALDMD